METRHIDNSRKWAEATDELVSVIIPTYNRAHLLPEAVTSVFASTYPHVEAIVIDDGSTDDTANVVSELQTQYGDRLRYVWQPNQRGNVARNHGLRLANGKYVLFLDSDDAIAPDKLARQVDHLHSRPDIDFSIGQTVRVAPDGKTPLRQQLPLPQNDWVVSQINGPWFLISSLLWRREALCLVGPWDQRLPGAQDWEFSARAMLLGLRYARCSEAVDYARMHSGDRITPKSWGAVPKMLACSALWERAQQSEFGSRLTPLRRGALWSWTFRSAYAVAHHEEAPVVRQACALLLDSSWGWRRLVAMGFVLSFRVFGSLPFRIYRRVKYAFSEP